jgi:hypothetical protein
MGYLKRLCFSAAFFQKNIARALAAVAMLAVMAGAQTSWTTIPSSGELRGIVFGNSEFVVVGGNGIVLTSSNGTDWLTQATGTSRELYCVAWGNNLFVAAGDSGTILTSPNGISWTMRASGTTNWLRGAAWADNQFIVVGGNGTVLTSPDGMAWTARATGTTSDLLGIAWGGSTPGFVAVGGYGSPAILTSPDGAVWTMRYTSATNSMLENIVWNGNVFTAVGDSGAIITSPTGITWTKESSGTTYLLADLVWAVNQFVVVGHGGVGIFGPILTSPEGVTWTSRMSSTTQWLYAIAWGNGLFVAVGTEGTIIISRDPSSGVLPPAVASAKGAGVRISGTRALYGLNTASHVSMKLFDIRGRLLNVLLDRSQAAGSYSESIRPAGVNLPAGKYLLSFSAGAMSFEKPVFLGP